MLVDKSWRDAQAKWLQRPEFWIRRGTLQAIAANAEASADYERWLDKMDGLWSRLFNDPTKQDLDDILLMLPSEDRAYAFVFAFVRIHDDALFWNGLAKWWSSFDAIDQAALQVEMLRRRAAWSSNCMLKKDLWKYGALPDRFTVYRGQDMVGEVKILWTLDPTVAESFARGHRGVRHPDPIILMATTEKENVAFYQSTRKEAEVVLFQLPKLDVTATRVL
jgi:hypothetical protein